MGEEVKIAPYKFGFLITKEELEQSRVWNSDLIPSWHNRIIQPISGAKYCSTKMQDGTRLFKMDIDSSYFRPDKKHWKRSSIRRKIKKLFKNLPPFVSNGLVLVLIWTDDSSWLSLRTIRENIEVWEDGRAEEPSGLWESVRSAKKWED